MTDMLVAQRREQLLNELQASGGLKVIDLAARLGVSRATVRRDLLDLENEGKLSRVRGGAMLATRHDSAAPAQAAVPAPRSAPAQGGPTVGLIVPSATYYYPRVVAGVQAVAAERGARVVITLSDYSGHSDAQRIEELAVSGASGLLVASPGGHELPEKNLHQLEDLGLPFVLLERQPRDPFTTCEFVASDHRQGAFAAVRHLAQLGHHKVALFTNGSPTAALLQAGHKAALEILDLDAEVPVVDSGRPTLGSDEATQCYDRFISACQEGQVRAALVHSDHDAIELMRRMRTQGLKAPEDLALIAYDDEIASLADVPLTAVAPPKRTIGEYAARLLLDRLAAPDPDSIPIRQMLLQPRLTIRSSCGTP
ncbi:substrate-binding domain-containing protein [Streptomyces sp. SID8379]|uniref:LacI family DNA-binding transcriptional regulator n=1 Tax=unclassified Streptomyces TaxID=2593676 RepID=UPI0004777F28|nr:MULTISPECIES: substrate-binding domain-containing protein [unclassified Streptomyces]MYW70416.1 substrate-binding domain-containing protein [Streptomyces sp. SID8379]